MRCLILGGDGYLGWPTAMSLSASGHEVLIIDNYLRRKIIDKYKLPPLIPVPRLAERCGFWKKQSGLNIQYAIGDVQDFEFLRGQIKEFAPEAIIHYAEQRSAPFSMMGFDEAHLTLNNNLNTTFNLIWAVMNEAPSAHIIKLGTMGEYGTPNIDIEEGWINIEHKGRSDRFLYPRQGSSLYHTTKIQDTDLLWFYVRNAKLKVTDLMQGPVYGLETPENENNPDLFPFFDYDDIFGTVLNRFVVQAVAGIPLTVYGKGGQIRGFLNICDTMQAIKLVVKNPPEAGEMRILNQFTEQFSVEQLANLVKEVAAAVGLKVSISNLENPRVESEEHYYKAAHTGLISMGLKPKVLNSDVILSLIEIVQRYKKNIDQSIIMPRVKWRNK